jgi:hypothetical protein
MRETVLNAREISHLTALCARIAHAVRAFLPMLFDR